MSPRNSDSVDPFDSVEAIDDLGADFGSSPVEATETAAATEEVAVTRPREPIQSRPFDVYSLMLILSFIMLTVAVVLLMIDINKY